MHKAVRDLRKAVLILAAAGGVCGVAFLLLLTPLLRYSLQNSAAQMFGTKLTFERFKVNPFRAAVSIAGLKLYNPPGFDPSQVMISVPRIELDFELWDGLVHRRTHFKTCVVEVAAFNYVRKADGSSNMDTFAKYVPLPTPEVTPGAHGTAPGQDDLLIDELNLTLGEISITDAANPALGRFSSELGIKDRKFTNVDSTHKLAQLTLAEVLPVLLLGQAQPAGEGGMSKRSGDPEPVEARDTRYGNFQLPMTNDQ